MLLFRAGREPAGPDAQPGECYLCYFRIEIRVVGRQRSSEEGHWDGVTGCDRRTEQRSVIMENLDFKLPLFEELDTLHEQESRYEQVVGHTGFETLDAALGGGLFPGQYIEIRGQSGTGKSFLCFSILENSLQDFRVVLFDSENIFIHSDCEELFASTKASCKVKRIYHVFDAEEILQALYEVSDNEEQLLCTNVLAQPSDAKIRPLLLIFDAISSCIAAHAEIDPQALVQIGLLLRRLASRFQAIVIVSNSVSSLPWLTRCAPVPPSGVLIETDRFLHVRTGSRSFELGDLRDEFCKSNLTS